MAEKQINPLNMKCICFYVRTQSVPRCRHSPPHLYKTKLLMMYKVKAAVCSEIHTQHINRM